MKKDRIQEIKDSHENTKYDPEKKIFPLSIYQYSFQIQIQNLKDKKEKKKSRNRLYLYNTYNSISDDLTKKKNLNETPGKLGKKMK